MGQGLTQLRLIGVHDSGEHLLLSDGDGGRYLLPLDESLKAAARRDRPRLGQLQIEIDGAIRPREVQALMRTGLTPEEIADRTGWSADRIRRYEAPVLAEREYAAILAQRVYVRSGSTPLTLGSRVSRRLHDRGVDPTATGWDAVRSAEGNWTVTATFLAGGRERTAAWYFDLTGRTVVAANDEARWLSEEDPQGGPIPAPHPPHPSDHSVTVFDVEADGGVSSPRPDVAQPIDLMQAMRDGSSVRSRRRRRRSPSPTDIPLDEAEDALPLEEMTYDPQTMGDPPGAHGAHPEDEKSLPASGDDASHDGTSSDAADTAEAGKPSDAADTAETGKPTDAAETAETGKTTDAAETAEAGKPTDAAETAEAGKPTDSTLGPPTPSGQRRPKGKRPTVPSWDDIMFGTRPPT